MNKMLWYFINLRGNLIKYIQFDGYINDVMFYFLREKKVISVPLLLLTWH